MQSHEDSEAVPTAFARQFSPRLFLASCFAQLMAPPGVVLWFDLSYATRDGTSFVDHSIGMLKAIPQCWRLATEPLVIAVLLTLFLSSIQNKRAAFAMIIVVTILNFAASGMMIIGRSL